jgi:hypothetical protein
MLASRRQLCSSRHNVREREVVARRQACVGDRGFARAAGRQVTDSDNVNMEGVGSWFDVDVDVDVLVWSVCRWPFGPWWGGTTDDAVAHAFVSRSLGGTKGGGAERWSGAGQQRDNSGGIAVGCQYVIK